MQLQEPIEAWENEGGSQPRVAESPLSGTVNQIAWAEQIKTQVNTEFDRVRRALESVAANQTGRDRADTQAMIAILEDKRAEVMANERAGYYIHDWQEMRDQVRKMIIGDSRYEAIKANQLARTP